MSVASLALLIIFIYNEINYCLSSLSCTSVESKVNGPLNADQLLSFYQNGYLIVKNWFSDDDISPLRDAFYEDPSLNGKLYVITDSNNNPSYMANWRSQSNDLIGMLLRQESFINAIEQLAGGKVYIWHNKIISKPPYSNGTWEYHQDFGSWYYDNLLKPEMLTASIAIDNQTIENGALIALAGTQFIGRIDHEIIGNAQGANKERVNALINFANYKEVSMIMNAGDVMFFHCNTLHRSGPNNSNYPRTLLHGTYNLKSNQQYKDKEGDIYKHKYSPIIKINDNIIKNKMYSSIFDETEFLYHGPTNTKSNYGYKILELPHNIKEIFQIQQVDNTCMT